MAETKSCANELDILEDVPFCKGEIQTPGTRPHAYWIPKSSILKWPKLPVLAADSGVTLETVAVYKENFELVEDKHFIKIELVNNQNDFKAEQTGNDMVKLFTNTATILVPGTSEKATGLAMMMNNEDGVLLVPQRDGKYRVIGSEAYTTTAKPSLDSGKASTDNNGITIEVSSEDVAPAPFYQGEILTSGGVKISGKDGSVVQSS